jgi:hypothetical protein
MRASLADTRRLRFVFTTLFLALAMSAYAPTHAAAKTRPPVEAGDPEVSNEKPRGGPAAASVALKSDDLSTLAATKKAWIWQRTLMLIRYHLAIWY